MEEKRLSNGFVVRVRSVPPMSVTDVLRTRPDLADPPPPMTEVESVAGGTQKVPSRPGEEAYTAWFMEKDRIEKLRDQFQEDFAWDYGIVDWKAPGEKTRSSQPPKDWELDPVLSFYGMEPRGGPRGRRVDYIRYEIFQTAKDTVEAQKVMYGSDLTIEEVDAAEAMFPGNEVREGDTGSTG